MSASTCIELFGYLGSLLVVASMLMTSVMKLRIINTIGSVIFAIYALIIKSYPTALMNFCLVGINIYHMLRLRNTQKHYDLVELRPEDGYLDYFKKYYLEDIRKYFPGFAGKNTDSASASAAGTRAFLICCDSDPAGLMTGTQNGDELDVSLDYSTPVYRDCSVGTFLYSELKSHGIRRLVGRPETAEHTAYLEKMGFTKDGDHYKKELA